MLAASLLLSGDFNRRGQWRRILVASVLAIMVALGGVGLRNLVVGQPMMVPAMYGFLLCVIGASLASLLNLIKPAPPPRHAMSGA